MTLIAVSIPVPALDDPQDLLGQAAQAHADGAELVEWRIDELADLPKRCDQLSSLIADSPMPSIVTCRSASEGGGWSGEETQRAQILRSLCQHAIPPRYIDIELACWTQSHDLRGQLSEVIDGDATSLILSIHDFERRPDNLVRRIRTAASEPSCSVIKVAYHARTLRDNLEIFELLRERPKPMIALAMGPFGQMSRILAGKFGAFATFASCEEDRQTAPGQLPVQELTTRYRFGQISSKTEVMGIVGWPAFHSKGPVIHNGVFAKEGIDAVFVAMPIAPEWASFKATVSEMLDASDLNLTGLSITTPHKPNALRFVKEMGGHISGLAAQIGVANTIAIGKDGDLSASNTDCFGAVEGLIEGMGIHRHDLATKKIALLGAGGAARAVAVGLLECDANITVFNRDQQHAEDMVHHLLQNSSDQGKGAIQVGCISELVPGAFDILINSTTVGMTGGSAADSSPLQLMGISSDVLSPDMTLYDIIYSPLETPLMRQAQANGAQVIGGLGMFLHQAMGQYEAWLRTSARDGVYQDVWDEHYS